MSGLRSERTAKAYAADLRIWLAWCEANDRSAFPADAKDVADWLNETASHKSHSTVRRRRSMIAAEHRDRGLPNPTESPLVTEAVAKSRAAGPRGTGPVRPLRRTHVAAALAAWAHSDDLIARRDAAALALVYAAAARPSEAINVSCSDVVDHADGVAVRLMDARFGSDGCWVGISSGRAATALLQWRDEVGEGVLLRRLGPDRSVGDPLSSHSLVDITARAAAAGGEPPQRWARSAGREGFLLDARELRLPAWLIAQHARLSLDPRPDPSTLVLHSPVRFLNL